MCRVVFYGRKPRDKTPDTVYHVIARGNNREALFLSDKDRNSYLELWRKYSREFEFEVYAYVLMTNHVHWMIRTGRVPISSIIHTIHGRYARTFNKKNNRVGHVFQGRFRSEICSDDRYVLALCRYIHLNPVEAGIVKKPLEYPWSSYKDLCGLRKDPLVKSEFLLGYFNRSGVTGFRRWVEEETTEEMEQQHNICGVSNKLKPSNGNKEKKLIENRPDLKKLAEDAAGLFKMSPDELKSDSKLPSCVAARKDFIRRAVLEYAYRRSEVARFLKKDRSLITKVLYG